MNSNLLHESKFGFQINNPTEHAILQLTGDIAQNFDKLKNAMFADDTNLFISDENIGELYQQMNKELKTVSSWFNAKGSLLILIKPNGLSFIP